MADEKTPLSDQEKSDLMVQIMQDAMSVSETNKPIAGALKQSATSGIAPLFYATDTGKKLLVDAANMIEAMDKYLRTTVVLMGDSQK